MKVYFETDFITIDYNEEHNAILQRWLIPPLSTEFREGLNTVIRAMEHFKTGKWVSDTCELGTVAVEDQEWIIADWLPRALEAGYSQIALIMPSEISLDAELSQFSVEEVVEAAGDPVPTAYFHNLESALTWISGEHTSSLNTQQQ